MLTKLLKFIVFNTGKLSSIYLRFGCISGDDYIEYLRKFGKFYAIGENCHINRDVKVLNPQYTRIGNNVCLSSCTLIGHDASVSVLNRAYGVKLDSVGKIDICDHVFIGMGAIILPNVTIGERSIIAAGAVVSRDVEPGSVMGGVPARKLGSTDDLVEKLKKQTKDLPWADLISQREGAYDSSLEPLLISQRVKYFFSD